MFGKMSLVAAFFLMAGAPLAGASEGARPSTMSSAMSPAIFSAHTSSIIVIAQEAQPSDGADSANNGDSNDSSDSDSDSQNADQNGDSDQNSDSNQTDQQNLGAPQGYQAPDSNDGGAGQLPSYSFPQQVNPNQ